ncbi:Phloem protein 2-like A10 [Apostasia shenzhenica]|uniref:Phloem protein 2-like A10 n=1 Tax=Apostasia shenzhenica TaxID=1088818 RepID=A0A2I0ANB3_9ASPA|nr:Phloem protein 2-like A10 [Apostasia shenzhenica]
MDESLLLRRRHRRNWISLLAAAALSAYGAYRIYHHPSIFRLRRKIAKLVNSLLSLFDSVSSAADTVTLVSGDLNRFLRSSSDEIPSSLRQVAKLASSEEVSGSVSRVFEAMTVGIARGIRSSDKMGPTAGADGFLDRVLDKAFSSAGSGFASVVVGSFARNLVIAFYSRGAEDGEDGRSGPNFLAGSRWVDVVCSVKSRELIADGIQVFVGTAVAVFLEKTMHINTYDEFFAGMTNPKHENRVREMLVSVCNGAMETLVRTSHAVLTNPSSASSLNLENDRRSSSYSKHDKSNGWIGEVSSTLAVPINRKLILDVTGRVTFESVRSLLDFTIWKVSEVTKMGMSSIQGKVLERGLEVVKYLTARSMVITTICFVVCMHMFSGTRCLM